MTKHTVEIVNADENEFVEISEDEYILDAIEKAGHQSPYSCREGMCTSCVARLIEGDVARDGMALDPEQKKDFALICSAQPLSDCKIEIDVQEELFGGGGDLDDIF